LTSHDSLVVHLTLLMCLHYLVKLIIARVLSPYITNTPCFVTKSYVPQYIKCENVP